MMLTNHDTSELVYCLMNTPFEIVEDEVRREHWKLHLIDEDLDVRDAVQLSHNFDQIPNELRIKKIYCAKKTKKHKQKIIERVKSCTSILRTIKNNFKMSSLINFSIKNAQR